MIIHRLIQEKLTALLSQQSAIALLGPRQVGKTTLAFEFARQHEAIYLDLEAPEDLAKLENPLDYLSGYKGKLVILDEIQRKPEIFQVLRVLIDRNRRAGFHNGQFLILGSASIDLLQQSSESLAGRIAYIELAGLNALEISQTTSYLNRLWLRGGFPQSYLSKNDATSFGWRGNFIRTYLERDIPQLGPRIPATTLRRLWTMLAHLQGSPVNASKLGESLDASSPTIHRYIDLLVDVLLARRLQPWFQNIKKRLVKTPKIYVRDSGLLHQLLGILDYESLLAHPILGASWEGFVIENLLSVAPSFCKASYYRSSGGAEIDLILQLMDRQTWAIEVKNTSAPKVEKGFYQACEDIQPTHRYIVYRGEEEFPLKDKVTAISLAGLMTKLRSPQNAQI